jgi:hypothetical protein
MVTLKNVCNIATSQQTRSLHNTYGMGKQKGTLKLKGILKLQKSLETSTTK